MNRHSRRRSQKGRVQSREDVREPKAHSTYIPSSAHWRAEVTGEKHRRSRKSQAKNQQSISGRGHDRWPGNLHSRNSTEAPTHNPPAADLPYAYNTGSTARRGCMSSGHQRNERASGSDSWSRPPRHRSTQMLRMKNQEDILPRQHASLNHQVHQPGTAGCVGAQARAQQRPQLRQRWLHHRRFAILAAGQEADDSARDRGGGSEATSTQ